MILNSKKIKRDFPLYKYNKNLIYLDSAATSLTPNHVIEALTDYYKKYNANVHRGVYEIGILATEMYDRAHRIVSEFINADKEEIIFNSGATFGINSLAYGLEEYVNSGDNIVLTRMEHHANLVPWQQLALRKGVELRFIEITENYEIDMQSAKDLIDEKTKIVSLIHASNVLGTITPVKEINQIAKKVGAFTIVDASQSVPHFRVNVQDLECDFLVFSGHKILGPTGIGVLYGSKDALKKLKPFMFGGSMISKVTYDESVWNQIPYKFEAGTPDISGAIGLAAGLEYIKEIGIDNIHIHGKNLTKYAITRLSEIPGITILSPKNNLVGVVSFVIDGVHSYDLGVLLDQNKIAVRTGHHCTQPLLNKLGYDSTLRISLYFYNSEDEIDLLIKSIKEALEIMKGGNE